MNLSFSDCITFWQCIIYLLNLYNDSITIACHASTFKQIFSYMKAVYVNMEIFSKILLKIVKNEWMTLIFSKRHSLLLFVYPIVRNYHLSILFLNLIYFWILKAWNYFVRIIRQIFCEQFKFICLLYNNYMIKLDTLEGS